MVIFHLCDKWFGNLDITMEL